MVVQLARDEVLLPITSPSLVRSLQRVSSEGLVDLVASWTQQGRKGLKQPVTDASANPSKTLDGPAATAADVEKLYRRMLEEKTSKKEILERFVNVDWKHGLSLRQWADVDFRVLRERLASTRWSTLTLSPVTVDLDDEYRRFQSAGELGSQTLSAGQIASGLQQELGRVLDVHITNEHLDKDHVELLRAAILPPDLYLDDGMLVSVDEESVNVKVVWLALPDADSLFFVSPPSAASNLEDDQVEKMVVKTVPRALKSSTSVLKLKPVDRPPATLSELSGSLKRPEEKLSPSIHTWIMGPGLLASSG